MSILGNDSSDDRTRRRPHSGWFLRGVVALAVFVSPTATLKAEQTKTADAASPERIAVIVGNQWSKLDNIYLKWSVQYHIHPAWAPNKDLLWAALVSLQEFAIRDKMIYSCRRLWNQDKQYKPLPTWQDFKNAYDGSSTITFVTDSAVLDKPPARSVATIHSGREEYSLFVGDIYLECVGGIFYDGKHLDWVRPKPDVDFLG